MTVTQYFLEYYNGCPLLIRVAWDTIGILSILIGLTLIFLKLYRRKLRLMEKIEKRYEALYEQDLINYLFAESEEGNNSEQIEIIENFKLIVKSPFKRKIVLKTLLKLKSEISGDIAEDIDRFYIQTGLVNYTFENVRSKDWHQNVQGIRELNLFNITKAHQAVLERVNHPRMEVRKEIQLYLVNLFEFKGLEFLDTLETPLSEWDQIQLLEILQKINTHETFEIKPWLKSKNDSVIIFALHLARIYNLFEVSEELKELLNHSNEKIRVEAINLLHHFYIIDAKDTLKDSFLNRSQDEQIAVFKMLENIYDPTDESFAIEHINHRNFETKVSARKILRDINLDKFKLTKQGAVYPINPLVDCSL